MKNEIQLDISKLQQFFDLAYKRHNLYVNKEIHKTPKPWTDDPIFLKYRFCNVFRHLDKTTAYIIKNVINPYANSTNLWKAIIIARFFSKIETIQVLIDNDCLTINFKKAVDILKDLHKKQSIMTSAFILNPLRLKGKLYPKLYTPYAIIKHINDRFGEYGFDTFLQKTKSLKEIFNELVTCPSTAGFMAYEYVTDIRYSFRYFSYAPYDIYIWGNFTIGSLRGLKRLCNIPLKDKFPSDIQTVTNYILKEWRRYVEVKKLDRYGFEVFDNLTMREVEHWLCEYDKYMRMKNGECKRLKRKYDGKN